MPQAPNNEIPYNEPWRAERRVQNASRLQGAGTRPPSRDAWLQRALHILENPSQPEGSWLSRLVGEGRPQEGGATQGYLKAAGVVAIVFTILAIIFALYQLSLKMSSTPPQARIRVWQNPSSQVKLRWSYPGEYAHEVYGFLIYRCPFAVVKNSREEFCLYEEDFTLVASVGREQRSFIDHLTHGVGFCYLISAYNRAGESKRTHMGCYVRRLD